MRWKSFFKYFTVLAVLPLMVGLAFFGLEEKGFFHVNDILVSISIKPSQKNFIKPFAEILDLKLIRYKGISLWRLPMKNVSETIEKEKWVKEFRISRSWPSTLLVEIEPVEISFLIQSSNKKEISTTFFPITSSGVILDKIDSKQTPSVAIAKDEQFLKNRKLREEVLTILNSLPAGGNMHQSQISEVGYSNKEGFWLSLVREDLKIKMGEDQYALKASRISQVLDYLEQRDLKARVIDANLSKKVLVRLQQTP